MTLRRPSPSAKSPAPTPGLFERPLVLYALLCVLAFIVYSNSFGLELTGDAYGIVHTDPRVRQFSAENLNLIFTKDYWWPNAADTLYRPITLLAYLINYAVLGDGERAGGYHALNFVLHGVNVCLLFALALRLLRNRTVAFCAAALWAIHPIGVETVTNVAGRADLLAAFAVFAALLLHAVSRSYLAACGIFALTLFGGLSKESALVLPGLLLLWDTLDWQKLRDRVRSGLPSYVASLAAIGVILLLRHQVLSPRPWPKPPYLENPLITADFWTARLTAIKVLGQGLWLLLFPAQLASDHSFNQVPLSGWGDPAVWISLLAICGIIGIALARRRPDPDIYFAVGFLCIAWLTTANLLVLVGSVFAERFLYLPAAGFAIAVAALLFRLPNQRAAQIAVAAILLLYAGRTYTRNFDWTDNLTLHTADVVTAPDSFRLHDLFGRALFVRNPQVNIDRSIQQGEAAWALLRDLPPERIPDQTLYHLGLYYGTKGEQLGGATTDIGKQWYAKAIATLERTRDISLAGEANFDRLQTEHGKPRPARTVYQPIYKTLGLLYSRMGRHEDALKTLRDGRAVNPETAEFYMLLAREYLTTGKPDQAAVIVLENAEIEGWTLNVINSLREATKSIPAASCAIGQTINYGCPWLAANTCTALSDLAQSFDESRRPERSAEIRRKASGQFGCR
jgi:tetratricopeptide (TPR) repeat protein